MSQSLLSHEAQLNQQEESLINAFNTQASLNRGQGRGEQGIGGRGRGSPYIEDKTNHEHSDHLEHSHNYQVRGGEAKDGPISPIFNVTTARSMATMNENAERSK